MNSKLFICYSPPLKNFLVSKGFKYEVIGLNPESKKTFWVFLRNEKFNETVGMWK